jgi:hypothetical protein
MRTRVVLASALLAACGGREQPAPPPAPEPIFTAHLPPASIEDGGPGLAAQCLPASASGADGSPDCIVARALYRDAAGTRGDVDTCRACSAPGLAPFPSSFPLDSIEGGLADYECVCLVEPPASCPSGDVLPASPFAWCPLIGPDARKIGCAGPQAIMLAPSVADGADVFVACYAPGTPVP